MSASLSFKVKKKKIIISADADMMIFFYGYEELSIHSVLFRSAF